MSDTEADAAPMEVEETPAVVEDAPPAKMDVKTALMNDGLARGLHECAKALDKRQAHLCVLASDNDEPQYGKLVEALCAQHEIFLLRVDDKMKLGEWAGLCKIDAEGNARKVVKCSCVVVKDYGSEGEALDVLLEHLKTSNASA